MTPKRGCRLSWRARRDVNICPALETGSNFVSRSLEALECYSLALGEQGYGALSGPGSVLGELLFAALMLFVAGWGWRLLSGGRIRRPEVLAIPLTLGVALTLVSSWPAVRTLLYDTVFHGPSEIATAMTAEPVPLVARLQSLDDAIVKLTVAGSGRADPMAQTTTQGTTASNAFQGVALADNFALGLARVSFLTAVLGGLGGVRFLAGLLVALTPLFALFLLFGVTRHLFWAWLKALLGLAMASLGATILTTLYLSMVEPWLLSALRARAGGYAIPSAPTEMLVMCLFFAILTCVVVGLCVRMMLAAGQTASKVDVTVDQAPPSQQSVLNAHTKVHVGDIGGTQHAVASATRADQIVRAIETRIDRENGKTSSPAHGRQGPRRDGDGGNVGRTVSRGFHYRRPRVSRLATRRDMT